MRTSLPVDAKTLLASLAMLLACKGKAPPDVVSACAAGDCQPCTEGARECRSSRLAECHGGRWIEQACDVACENGVCVSCREGESRCADSTTMEACADGRFIARYCDSGVCVQGRCECPPVPYRCGNVGRERCEGAGTWTTDACPSDLPVCQDGECLRCAPGTTVCANETISRVCSHDGESQGETACPQGCEASTGMCREPCLPGERRCKDRRVAEACRDDGEGFDTAARCRTRDGEVCSEGECVPSCDLAARTLSPAGCSFVTPPARYWQTWNGNDDAGRLVLVLINPDPEIPANVTVTVEGSRRPVVVPPASSESISIPARTLSLQSRREAGAAIGITSSVPILVLTHHADMQAPSLENAFSGDAAYLLPEHLLRCGGDRYRILAHPGITHQKQDNAYSGGVAIVSLSEETTTVQLVNLRGGTLGGSGIDAFQQGQSPILDLQPGEVVFLMSASPPPCNSTVLSSCPPPNDLTGTLVLSDSHAVALFTTGLSRVPVCHGCHVQTQFSEQLPPVGLWRSEHVSAVRYIPEGRPTDDERWTFVSDQDEVTLRFEPAAGGPGQPLLSNAGDQFTFQSVTTHEWDGDYVNAYPGYRAFRVTAEDADGAPASILAGRYYHTGNNPGDLKGGSTFEVERPVDYWRNEYRFSGIGAGQNRMQIIVPEGEELPLLDGAPISGATDASAAGFRIHTAPISPSMHHIVGSARFSLFVYGHQGLGPTNAYGYVGPLGFGDRSTSCGQ